MKTRSLLSLLLSLCLLCLPQASLAKPVTEPPDRIILMIADGLGFAQVAASGMYRFGAPGTQCYEQWPVQLAMSTYPHGGSYDPQLMWSDPDWQRKGATDSAASATAMATGEKTINGAISEDPWGNALQTVVEAAARHGMRTGVVSTVPFSHATPACFGAHVQSRSEYQEIARQMIWESPLDLVIGCGHPWFDNAGKRKPEADYKYISESDWLALQDGVAGLATHNGGKPGWSFIDELQDFQHIADEGTDLRIFGMPRVWGTLQAKRPHPADNPYQSPLNENLPDLATLSLAALNTLENDNGFFLMIEGGAVDWAAHDRDEARIIEEMQDFNYAVDVVSSWIEDGPGWENTLLIVTGDHECGHLCRDGSDLLDHMPGNRGAGVMPEMECSYGSHTNQLIPLYARGHWCQSLPLRIAGEDPLHGAWIDNAVLGWQLLQTIPGD
ncbi:MAG: alkaline phosphatase [Planctomycetales bacterium]|nr:alkaline phosphatase [bacterium]UNM06889.1 MAG: alkaline phosphatase [Planctomycetales bacterium]